MTKKIFAVLLFCVVSFASGYAQKFTKREQMRREAREKYYFCGNMFTFTAGYNHAWLTKSDVSLASKSFGKTEMVANTKNTYNLGFLWDHAFKNHQKWSFQTGLYYTQKGGEHLYFYDNGLGYGPQLREEETAAIDIKAIELQGLFRYTIPIVYDQRITINAGPYLSKYFDSSSEVKNWDYGVLVGLGYDYKHWSASVNYQPGVLYNAIKSCDSKVANISVNIGYRLWKK